MSLHVYRGLAIAQSMCVLDEPEMSQKPNNGDLFNFLLH